jgi:uncharacterized membrane protein
MPIKRLRRRGDDLLRLVRLPLQARRPPPPALKYGAATAFALFGATIFLLHGIAIGQASVLVPVAQMGFIVAALLGILVLGEPLTLPKAAGLISALAARAVLAAS